MTQPANRVVYTHLWPKKQSATGVSGSAIIEWVCTVALLAYMSNALAPFINGPAEKGAFPDPKPITLAVKVGAYLIVALLQIRNIRKMIQGFRSVAFVLLPVFMAVLSIMWSQYPRLTFSGSVILFATSLFGVYFGVRYTIAEQLRVLACMFAIVITLSYACGIALPAYSIEQEANVGAWKGIFPQKNNLAEIAVFSTLVFLCVRPLTLTVRIVAVVSALGLLVLARSSTGVVVLGVTLLALPFCKLVKQSAMAIALSVTLAASFGIAAALIFKPTTADMLQLLNRSPDLTGRVDLWKAVIVAVEQRPWLGYGFSAFWTGTYGESRIVVQDADWGNAGYAHNGYLDLLLHLGYVGLGLFFMGYCWLCRNALKQLFRSPNSEAVWACSFLLCLLIYNCTEGYIMTQNDVYWVIYISTAVRLAKVVQSPSTITASV